MPQSGDIGARRRRYGQTGSRGIGSERLMADGPAMALDQTLANDTVTAVRAVPISIPLETPLRFSTCAVHARQYLLVSVETSGGLSGVAGGISEWMKITHVAQTFGLPVAPHWNADIHVHLAGAARDVLTVEYFAREQDVFNFERILGERLKPVGGLIKIPQRPGLGLVIDEAAVEHFRL